MADKSLPLLSRLDSRGRKSLVEKIDFLLVNKKSMSSTSEITDTTGIGTNDGDWQRTHKQPPAIKLSKIFEPKINLTYYSFKIFPQF